VIEMTTPPPIPSTKAQQAMFDAVARTARDAGVFGAVDVRTSGPIQGVVCEVRGSATPAHYRITSEGGRLFVEFTTPDRWLSHSIEADLLNTGDKLEDLIDEELVDLGSAPWHAKVEHFRNADKLFVFRSPLPSKFVPTAEDVGRALLAYEACFGRLGDVGGGSEG
jgi:hypothetical protein